METRNETVTLENEESRQPWSQRPATERKPRFRLIKLEERIAPGSSYVLNLTKGTVCVGSGVATTNATPSVGCTTNPTVLRGGLTTGWQM
jgi:hypothetical protein